MKTVLVTGTFDFLHSGHLHLFKNAKKYGKKLVVLVARDKTVKKIKGTKPIHTEKERFDLVKHIDLVDEAILGCARDPYRKIGIIKPNVICLGYDQQHEYAKKLKDKLKKRGWKIKVVRLKAHKPKRLKSSQLRKIL